MDREALLARLLLARQQPPLTLQLSQIAAPAATLNGLPSIPAQAGVTSFQDRAPLLPLAYQGLRQQQHGVNLAPAQLLAAAPSAPTELHSLVTQLELGAEVLENLAAAPAALSRRLAAIELERVQQEERAREALVRTVLDRARLAQPQPQAPVGNAVLQLQRTSLPSVQQNCPLSSFATIAAAAGDAAAPSSQATSASSAEGERGSAAERNQEEQAEDSGSHPGAPDPAPNDQASDPAPPAAEAPAAVAVAAPPSPAASSEDTTPAKKNPKKPKPARKKEKRIYRHEPFPRRLYRLLEEVKAEGRDDIISFTPDGKSVRVHSESEFEILILPRYFRHSRISSFHRQLLLYGFDRIKRGPYKGSFRHRSFRRDCPDRLDEVQRAE